MARLKDVLEAEGQGVDFYTLTTVIVRQAGRTVESIRSNTSVRRFIAATVECQYSARTQP